jgi:membrane glycosyltransferase
MDSVRIEAEPASRGNVPAPAASWLPPDAPLALPVQSLESWTKPPAAASGAGPATWLMRAAIFGSAGLLTVLGGWQMFLVISVGSSVTALQWLLLGLFVVNFSWIAFAFTSAIAGFVSLLFRQPPETLPVPASLASRTAILMPVYNEAPARVFGAVSAMAKALCDEGYGEAFDIFFLSDSTDPDAWIDEERAFLILQEKALSRPGHPRVFYRHRPKNIARKAGNIADFVGRWGAAYAQMIVLDADSLMSAQSIAGLAHAMEQNPRAGIIQTLPLIINRNTLFARLQQFAARIYGPVIAEGLRLWMGQDGNYWGHNAIIRTRAFAEHCMLPDLPGKPPFGGHILSHDFVEAALMRRAGYEVIMTRGLVGSYEESPPSVIDLAARDRRWAQGNLQHIRVLGAKGFTLASRQHFATGIFSYLASPLWLLQLLVGLIITLQANYLRPEYFTKEFSLYPDWPRFDAERSLMLFGLTMAILLAPKFFGLAVALANGAVRRKSGGAIRLIASTLLEILLSALFAPMMMLIQSRSVYEILTGKDSGWKTQRRDDGSIPFSVTARRHMGHTLLGLAAGLSAFLLASTLAGWMAPTLIGLVLAIPLSHASGLSGFGLALKSAGLLSTPEETTPPAIAHSAAEESRYFEPAAGRHESPLLQVGAEAHLLARHSAALPQARRKRGEITPERAMAETKLSEAADQAEAAAWLDKRETMVVLADRALLAAFTALPAEAKKTETKAKASD